MVEYILKWGENYKSEQIHSNINFIIQWICFVIFISFQDTQSILWCKKKAFSTSHMDAHVTANQKLFIMNAPLLPVVFTRVPILWISSKYFRVNTGVPLSIRLSLMDDVAIAKMAR